MMVEEEEWPVHPAAAVLPMLSEPALAELAEDIKSNGLRQPIVLDPAGRILDGRNRLAACRLAGVEPSFVDYHDDDPMGFVVSLNVKRRSLTKPQLAMAAARAWQLAQADGLVQGGAGRFTDEIAKSGRIITDPRTHFGRLFGVSKNYAEMARRVLSYSPELADQVAKGDINLDAAYDQAMAAERLARQEADTLRRLREVAPDLYERIELDKLSITEADAIFRERDREYRETRRQLYRLLDDATKLLRQVTMTPPLVDLPEILEVEEFEQELREIVKGGVPELAERLRELPDASKILNQLARDFERRNRRRA